MDTLGVISTTISMVALVVSIFTYIKGERDKQRNELRSFLLDALYLVERLYHRLFDMQARQPETYEQTGRLVRETDLMLILEGLEKLKNQSVRWKNHAFYNDLNLLIFKCGELQASLDSLLRPFDRFMVDDDPTYTIAPVIMQMAKKFISIGRAELLKL